MALPARRRAPVPPPHPSMRVALRGIEEFGSDDDVEEEQLVQLSCDEIIRRFKGCRVYQRTRRHYSNDPGLCSFLKSCGAAKLLQKGETAEADQLVKDELSKRK